MVDIDKLYTNSDQQSSWINANMVKIGDKYQILDEGTIDNTSFKNRRGDPIVRINFKVRNTETKEEYNLGLSKTRIQSIRDSFNEKLCEKWKDIGFIEVVGLQNYPSLNSKGILWRGVRTDTQKTIGFEDIIITDEPQSLTPTKPFTVLNPETEKAIQTSRHLIEMGIPLSVEDFKLFPRTVQLDLVNYHLVTKGEKGDIFFNKDACQKYLK